jgi:hypothetical protein
MSSKPPTTPRRDSHLVFRISDEPADYNTACKLVVASLDPSHAATAKETALAIDAVIPGWKKDLDYANEDSVATFLMGFWQETLEKIAMRVPAQSTQQDRLVELSRQLYALDKTSVPV